MLTLLQTQQLDVSRLVHRLVLTSCFSEIFAARGAVQYVIGNLEGETDVERELLARLDLGGSGTAEYRTRRHGNLEQRARFVNMYPLQVVEGRAGLGLAFQVHDLPARQALGADGPTEAGDDVDDFFGGNALGFAGHVLERGAQERVAREDRDVLSVDHLYSAQDRIIQSLFRFDCKRASHE